MVRKIAKGGSAQQAAKQTAAPPAPFTTAPSELAPFLEHLDPSHVYLIHVDNFPVDFKKRIFSVPVILNLVIALGLAWRLWIGVPGYLELLASITGHESSATVDTASKTTGQLIWIVIRRTLTFAMDFLLFGFIAPWPKSFFYDGPANPIFWRWHIGFRNLEIVVRESRNWTSEDLIHGAKSGGDSPYWKTRVAYAIEPQLLRSKTGYMLMDKNWDLDFHAMIAAHQYLDAGTVPLKLFGKTVLAYHATLGWLVWQVWKLDDEGGGAEEENRLKIVALKDRLTAMGKESLFFRWVEIVQYESNQPGGFGPEKQQATLKKVQDVFDEQGVDFEALIKEMGGLEGTPGMERTS